MARRDVLVALVSVVAAVGGGLLPLRAMAQASASGQNVYGQVCSACHQAGGQGLAGAFPPLAGHVADLARKDGGRAYLISVVLFGLQGQIDVNDQTYNGVMPAQGRLSDEEVAAVLTFLSAEGAEGPPVEPFAAQAVAEVRPASRSPQDNLALRKTVVKEAEVAQAAPGAPAGEAPPPPTYTEAQVQRARPVYRTRCAECHGEDLRGGGMGGGAPLSGLAFERKWSGKPVSALYDFLRTQMPRDRPASLTDQQYADLVALILRANGYQAGSTEVPPDSQALRGRAFE